MATRWLNGHTPVEVGARGRPKGSLSPTKPTGFSPSQLDTLQVWRDLTDRKGYPPSKREVAAAREVGVHTIEEVSRILVRKGALDNNVTRRSRGTLITDLGRSLIADRAPALYLPRCVPVTPEKRCDCGILHFRAATEKCFQCDQSGRASAQ